MTGKGQNTKNSKRRDSNRIVLRSGEGQRPNGSYEYRWTDADHKRQRVYAKTLDELRQKEEEIQKNLQDGIKTEARYKTVNDIYEVWRDLKRGLKDNTFQNYQYVYNMFVREDLGKMRVADVKKSDVKRFYNTLADNRRLQISTIESIQTVIHQVFDMAVDDAYIRNNPTDNALKDHPTYGHWYPIIAVMLGTGLRVGEVTGLRWCDVDLEEGFIDVNHTRVYYDHRITDGKKGCYFAINTPKTKAGERQVPMLGFVKEAFQIEKQFQQDAGIKCEAVVDGYTDFIFVNRFGLNQHQTTLNKAIKRIIRDCNDAQLLENPEADVLLPNFSCHSLRHTFTTRLVESGTNIKVIQDTLGHADISTTLNIYADATKELKKSEFANLDAWFQVQ